VDQVGNIANSKRKMQAHHKMASDF